MAEVSKRQPPRAKPGGLTVGGILKWFFLTIWRLIVTTIMVGIITGCIVACVLTVYILQYIGADEQIDLDTVRLGYTSIMYAENPEGDDPVELQRLYISDSNRIWVNYDDITDYTKQALIAIEDKRFDEHQGVDWRRTFGAFLNMFAPGTATGGGSTITQQLIKNLTEDDDLRVDRKVREIFRALDVSRRYSREQILESYLNVVSFGNGTNGIQSAANTYFDKDAKDLTLAESAAIVGITRAPTKYNPFFYPENNKERREYILEEMLEQERITQKEYDEAMAQKLEFKSTKYYETVSATPSYFEDHVINSVIADLMEQRGMTESAAFEELYQGGYSIYTTVDLSMQAHLENIYSSEENFPPVYNQDYPQSACVITDPNGKILAMVGKIGQKEGARTFNRATMAKRHPGSSFKPLATYSLAIDLNRVTWSTMIEDSPMSINEPGLVLNNWPVNHYRSYDGNMPVVTAIQRSTNTVAAKVLQQLTPQVSFDFLRDELGFDSLVEREVINGSVSSDINIAPLALGALTYGVTPLEMAGGYQIFINGGTYTKPYAYSRVVDANGRVVLEPDTTARQVIAEDSSVVMNKLLQKVVDSAPGTGTTANLGTMPTGGKTGTSDQDIDQWFIGFTPYYVCQVWMGYDEQQSWNENGQLVTNTIRYPSYPPPILFKTIMAPLHEGLEYASFMESDEVLSAAYCTITGDLAGGSCPQASGWYRKSKVPSQCTGVHVTASTEGDGEEGEEGDSEEGGSEDGGAMLSVGNDGRPNFWPESDA